MDRRTKLLTAVFGSFIGYAVLAQLVYPRWIKPLFTLDERIAERQQALQELEKEVDRVERAKADYLQFLSRNGSTEIARVSIDLRGKLNALIEKHRLERDTVSPGRESPDLKTGLMTMSVDVTAEAPLPAVIEFLKDVSEIPQLLKVKNVKIAKVSGSRTSKDAELVALTLPLEIMVPPANKLVGPIADSQLKPHDFRPRHLGRDYSAIWNRKPFTEYEQDKPISITMKPKTVSPKVGAETQLQALVSGGNGELAYAWTPTEGLSDASILTPKVDTTAPGKRVYTLTVTDGRGKSAKDVVTVNIQDAPPERPSQPPPVETPPTPVKAAARPWPEGKFMQVGMIWSTIEGVTRTDELSVNNTKTRCTDYYKVGDGFDGGELVFLHQNGAVVRRNDEYWLYPIGTKLDEAVPEQEGGLFPDLQNAAKRHRVSQAPKEPVGQVPPGVNSGQQAAPVLLGGDPMAAEIVGPPTPAELQTVAETAIIGPPAPSDVSAGTPPPDTLNNRAKAKRAGNMAGNKTNRKGPAAPGAGATNEPKRSAPEKNSEKQTPPVPE